MFKRACLQLHWLIGISAGLVLAVMGLTGGMYSFSNEFIKLIDPQITSVNPPADSASALTPAVLLARVSERAPYASSLTLSAKPDEAARIGFMKPVPGSDKKKFELQYLNPYTGELLGKPASEDFFRQVLDLHRKLGMDETGKAITGAATLALLLLILSGLYLRWPKTAALNWRSWLYINRQLSGRDFLSNLHAVLGTCAILAYLLFALTSLSWSYEWYRKGLNTLAGNDTTQTVKPAAKTSKTASASMPSQTDLDAVWNNFKAEVPHYRKLILLLPSGAGKSAPTVQILYLDTQAPHPYANSRMVFDAASGVLQSHERYADKSLGAKLMASLYALHSGSFFGTPGMLIMMLAALLLPVFALTGWVMYLHRQRKNALSIAVG
jgi:sulfite reductase (NADPH) flavoprotein alpha-component